MNKESTNNTREKKLDQKIVVITGAGDGLGRSLAITCAREGATVVLLGRTLKKLEAVYDEIEDLHLPTPAIFPINFESATSLEYKSLHAVLDREFQKVDVIIHNAGTTNTRTPISNTKIDEWNKAIQVNATAPFLLSKALLPLLERSNNGKLVFTSHVLAHQGKAYWGAYAAAKATALNLMQTLADELEESTTTVFSVDPVAVRSNFRANAFPAEDPTTTPSADEVAEKYVTQLIKNKEDLHGQSVKL